MGAYRIVVPIIAPTDAAAASTRATAAAFDIVGSHGLVFWLNVTSGGTKNSAQYSLDSISIRDRRWTKTRGIRAEGSIESL